MLLLIDTRERRPEAEPERSPARRPPWEPNWRLWAWVALALGAAVGADAATGLAAYVLVIATLVCACQAICVVLPSTFGLREYRQ